MKRRGFLKRLLGLVGLGFVPAVGLSAAVESVDTISPVSVCGLDLFVDTDGRRTMIRRGWVSTRTDPWVILRDTLKLQNGFMWTSSHFELSKDKTLLTFEVVDKEIIKLV